MAGVFGHDRLSAASTATAPSPAGLRRLRQVSLPRTPATPNTLTYSQSRSTAASLRRKPQSTSRPAANPVGASLVGALDSPSPNVGEGPGVRPDPLPCPAGGPQGGQFHSTPSPGAMLQGRAGARGATIRTTPTPTKCILPSRFRLSPRPCSTAVTGFLLRHHSRAPPRGSPPKNLPLSAYGPPAAAGGRDLTLRRFTAVRPVFSCASAPQRRIRPGPRQVAGHGPGRGADGSRTGCAAYRTGGHRWNPSRGRVARGKSARHRACPR